MNSKKAKLIIEIINLNRVIKIIVEEINSMKEKEKIEINKYQFLGNEKDFFKNLEIEDLKHIKKVQLERIFTLSGLRHDILNPFKGFEYI